MPPRTTRTPPRTTRTENSGDTRSAKTQLQTADATARVGKPSRVKVEAASKGGITCPLTVLVPELDEDGEQVLGEDGKVVKVELTENFILAEDVGIMPLMEWAAASDVDVSSAAGLRAVYYVLQDAVEEAEWARFRRFTRDHKVGGEKLLDFANAALEALAGRPTEESTGS